MKHGKLKLVNQDCTKDVPDKVLPIFITVDPARDDVNTVAEYIKGSWKFCCSRKQSTYPYKNKQFFLRFPS